MLLAGIAIILFSNNGLIFNQIKLSVKSLQGDLTGSSSVGATLPPPETATYNSLNKETGNTTDSYTPLQITYGYDSLQTSGQKKLYDEMANVVYNESDEQNDSGRYPLERINIDGEEISEAQIRVVLEAFGTDHPKIFWLSNVFGYYSNTSTGTIIQMYAEYSPEQVESGREKLDNEIENIISAVPKGLSEFDRELYIHDIITSKCVYEKDTKHYEDDKAAFSMYGALINGKAVCEGYAKATEYLLNCIGVECITVNG